jgi:hypothetical protein
VQEEIVKITIELPDQLFAQILEHLKIESEQRSDSVAINEHNDTIMASSILELKPRGQLAKGRIRSALNSVYARDDEFRIQSVEELCRTTERLLRHSRIHRTAVEFLKAALAEQGLRLNMTEREVQMYREGRFKLNQE